MNYLFRLLRLQREKVKFTFPIFCLICVLSLSPHAFADGEYKVEVHCKETLKTLKKSDLCGSSSRCSWTALSQSETASNWSYKKKQIVVREVPNRNMLRISFKEGAGQLKMPWCPDLKDLNLSEFAIESIRKSGEVQYLIAKKDNSQLRLLKTINNVCRKLKTKNFYRNYKLYYLEASDNRSCQRVMNNLKGK